MVCCSPMPRLHALGRASVARRRIVSLSMQPSRCGEPAPLWLTCWLRTRPHAMRVSILLLHSISPPRSLPRHGGSIPRCAMPPPSASDLRQMTRATVDAERRPPPGHLEAVVNSAQESTRMADLFGLSGRHALVTGASSGLGRHFAGVLARAGAQVTVAARREAQLAQTVAL